MVDTMLGRGRTLFERIRRDCLSQILFRLGVKHTCDDIESLLTTSAVHGNSVLGYHPRHYL